jgi:uncharacterized glyoxalase superfamily metalloenzyme YdcJ
MLSLDASSILIVAGIAGGIYWLARRVALLPDTRSIEHVEMQKAAHQGNDQLERNLAALEALVSVARQESQRLEAAVARAESLEPSASRDTLAAIEDLADPEMLADDQALAETAAKLPRLPSGVVEDFFRADEKSLSIARLLDQGRTPAEISRQLKMPLGEVEFLLSLRPA